MLCTVHRPAAGIDKCTHITSFGVSALTLGVVGDVTCNYRRENPMLDETYFFDGDRSAAKNVVTGEFTSLGTRNFLVCQCDVNDRWLMASGSSSSSPLVLTIAKVSETPMGIVVGIPCSSEVLPPCWIGFNSSNPEQAVTVYLSEANATNMSFTIQVISIQALLRKELAIMSSTKFITPRKYPELQSVLWGAGLYINITTRQ
ncbi:hypothetical protein Pelo_19386 [Pelomyxa schiedti]|nr:hypothetical protein Pelo_19386 [Pelomyxa schiedti]